MRLPLRLLVPFASLAIGVLAVVLPGGCGSASNSVPTTVRGVVQFQGQPLAGGMIVFAPDSSHGTTGSPLRAELAADGTFQLQREASRLIPPGWYRVAIADAPAAAGSGPFSGARPPFPARLRRPDRSELLRQVFAGQDNVFEFLIDVPPTAVAFAP